ncbi:hypothetical protein [Caudoviricetes sp.]|nr:hypothetical protein [Caudoviricetes sp.]
MKTIVILVYIFTTSGGVVTEKKYEVDNMETCLAIVHKSRILIPRGGDAESTVSLFCATEKK